MRPRASKRHWVPWVLSVFIALSTSGCAGGSKLAPCDISEQKKAFTDMANDCAKKEMKPEFKAGFLGMQQIMPQAPEKTNMLSECCEPLKNFFSGYKDMLQKGCDATGDENAEKAWDAEYQQPSRHFSLPMQKSFISDFCEAGCAAAMEESDALKKSNIQLCNQMKPASPEQLEKDKAVQKTFQDLEADKAAAADSAAQANAKNSLIEKTERTPLGMPGADAHGKLDVPIAVAVDAVGQPGEPAEVHPTHHTEPAGVHPTHHALTEQAEVHMTEHTPTESTDVHPTKHAYARDARRAE